MSNSDSTRLSRYCERVIEGGWLAALVAAPLFFNVFSSRIFDPDKSAVVRTIGLIVGLSWIIKGLEWIVHRHRRALPAGATNPVRDWLKRMWSETGPLFPLVFFLLIDLGVASVFSVAPEVSFQGSYPRLQGFYTTSTYVLVFFSIAAFMRSRGQVDRLISTALVVSLPVALYGIIQYFGTDPHSWESDVTARVASSMGNPLFVAAFLILTVPLALYRLSVSGAMAARGEKTGMRRILIAGGVASLAFQMIAWQAGPIAGTASAGITVAMWIVTAVLLEKSIVPFLRISCYTVVLSAQLMCLLFSQSRGPWLGLVAGLFIFMLLWTIVRGRRRQSMVVIGSGLTTALVLIVLNWPGSPLGFVRDIPYAERLARLSNVETGSARVRVLIWEGVEDLITADPARALTGYGPETLYLVFPPHYPPELARFGNREAMPDRAHNETFDVLVATGLPGLLIYLFFVTSLFYYGLKWTGTIRTSRHRLVFLALWFGCGGVAVIFARLIDDSWRFAGLSLPLGMLAGLAVYLGLYAIFTGEDRSSGTDEKMQPLVGVALLAALTAHFFEIQLGPAVTATRVYFWSCAAVLVAFGIHPLRSNIEPTEEAVPFRQTQFARDGVIAGLVLLTLVYDFFVTERGLAQPSTVVWLMVFTWVLASLLVTTESWRPVHILDSRRSSLGYFVAYSLSSGCIAILFAIVHGSLLRSDIEASGLPITYFAAVVLIILVFAVGPVGRKSRSFRIRPLGILYLLLVTGILFFAYRTNVEPIRADVYFKQANQLREQGRYEESVSRHGRAIALEPTQDVYYMSLAKTLLEEAAITPDSDDLQRTAEKVLAKARSISPLNPDHATNLARLYRTWAERTDDPRLKSTRFRRALGLFDQAAERSPNMINIWNDKAALHLSMGDTAGAIRAYRHSLALDDSFYQTHLFMGHLHYAQGRWSEAADAYQRALEQQPKSAQARIGQKMARRKITMTLDRR